MFSNRDVADLLYELADYMEIDGENPFRANAYRRAARAVERLREPISEWKERLTSIEGIGKGTAAVIQELLETGEITQLQAYREKMPPGLMTLLAIPGLGPKSVKTLYRHLNITNVEALEKAILEKAVRNLPGFGAKSEAKILEGIKRAGKRPERLLLGHALPAAEQLLARIARIPGVEKASLAGSIRRMEETVKDIDLIVAAPRAEEAAAAIVELPEVHEVIDRGPTKVSIFVQAEWPVQVDVRIVTPEQYATALHHFTGSKEHNVRIRQLAKQKGWKVNEYGVEQVKDGRTMTFASEAEFFGKLGLPYIPPELRQGQGETAYVPEKEKWIGDLVTEMQIKGDLHMHSVWSDGRHSIREMAEAAKAKGYEYIAITDHSRSLAVAGGLSIDELMQQREEIEQVNREVEGITVLAGVEMDILPDGRLDYPDDVLRALDFVIASVHSSFQQDERTMTKRILHAIDNPHVHMIAHPTGRLINRRDGYAVNLQEIFKRAAETKTVLELNANPNRLDLSAPHLRQAVEEYGVMIAVNTDAHRIDGLDLMRYGIGTARRGRLTAAHILNTRPLDEVLAILRRKGQ